MVRVLVLLIGMSLLTPLSVFGGEAFAAHKGKKTEEGIEFEPACPQARNTPTAPEEFLRMNNPLEASRANLFAGQTLFHFDAEPGPCRVCHGISGNGLGILFRQLSPGSRNFSCDVTMDKLPDGQLFWVIKNGSPGTAMPAFKNLDDDQIWQLVLYIRHFSEN